MSIPFTLYHSDSIGVRNNCMYPHEVVVSNADSLKQAVSHDYVAVAYKGGYRGNDNFIKTNCLALDCDNDHSENPDEWVRPADLKAALPDVAFAVHFSRNNEKQKGDKPARPRFHCFFPIPELSDPEEYKRLKQQVQTLFPFFDPNAVDAARFFFGTDNPGVELYEGSISIAEVLCDYSFEDYEDSEHGAFNMIVAEGTRNTHMSLFAGKLLKRYGDVPASYEAFLKEAENCVPPLPTDELNSIWRSALSFYKKVSSQDGYIPPEKYNIEMTFCPEDFTDVGQATVLKNVSKEELRYSPATDYICYNGIHWEESKHGAQGVAQKLTTNQLEEANSSLQQALNLLKNTGALEILAASGKKKAESAFNKQQAAAYKQFSKAEVYRDFALKRRDSKNITSTLKEARPMLAITPQELDADEFVLCTPGATYDLRLGLSGAREHKSSDFNTKVTSVSPSDKGADIWQKQLDLVFCSDRELIDYVQLVCGLALVGRVYIEQMIIAYGQGANGKSTFWNTVSRVLGTYSGKVSSDALIMGCRRNVKPEMAELKSKRLIIASELEEGTRLNTATVKQLSSTDDIYAEKKYKDPFFFTPSHSLVLYTNHLPKVGAIDEGTWRRLIVVPFNAHIVGKSDIKNFADYLYENAGEAILAWCIEGARKVIKMNYKIKVPKVVEDATAIYREQNNWLAHFVNDRCELGDDYEVKSGDLYQTYRSYCSEVNEFIRSTAEFYTALTNAGFGRKRTRSANVITGLRLKNTDFSSFEDFLR